RTSAAVAATAFLSASLFVAYDIAHTISSTRQDLAVIGDMLAADLARRSADEAVIVMDSAGLALGGVAQASLTGGSTSALLPLTQAVDAGPHGTLTVSTAPDTTIAGIAARGATAFALAGLLVLATARRRHGMPDAAQRENYHQLAAAIPMGLACWTARGQL